MGSVELEWYDTAISSPQMLMDKYLKFIAMFPFASLSKEVESFLYMVLLSLGHYMPSCILYFCVWVTVKAGAKSIRSLKRTHTK